MMRRVKKSLSPRDIKSRTEQLPRNRFTLLHYSLFASIVVALSLKMPDYTYTDLRPEHSTRLLTLLASRKYKDPREPIQCQLSAQLKGNHRHYDALSYAWDNQKPTSSIVIISENVPHDFPVIPNLEEALRQFRHQEHAITLWIDAICINQASTMEKSHQVPQMSRIYGEADTVRIWLGKESSESQRALSFIERILDFENFDSLISNRELVSEWASLLWLMKRPWFGRRWVIQEVALA
jgi:hypothetical protein